MFWLFNLLSIDKRAWVCLLRFVAREAKHKKRTGARTIENGGAGDRDGQLTRRGGITRTPASGTTREQEPPILIARKAIIDILFDTGRVPAHTVRERQELRVHEHGRVPQQHLERRREPSHNKLFQQLQQQHHHQHQQQQQQQ